MDGDLYFFVGDVKNAVELKHLKGWFVVVVFFVLYVFFVLNVCLFLLECFCF